MYANVPRPATVGIEATDSKGEARNVDNVDSESV